LEEVEKIREIEVDGLRLIGQLLLNVYELRQFWMLKFGGLIACRIKIGNVGMIAETGGLNCS
jgi:hypothetical protein